MRHGDFQGILMMIVCIVRPRFGPYRAIRAQEQPRTRPCHPVATQEEEQEEEQERIVRSVLLRWQSSGNEVRRGLAVGL